MMTMMMMVVVTSQFLVVLCPPTIILNLYEHWNILHIKMLFETVVWKRFSFVHSKNVIALN